MNRPPTALTESVSTAKRALEVLRQDIAISGFKRRQFSLINKLRESLSVVEFLIEYETAAVSEPWTAATTLRRATC